MTPNIQRQAGMFPDAINSIFTPTKTTQKIDITKKLGGPPCSYHSKTMSLGARTVEEITRNNTPRTTQSKLTGLAMPSRLNPTNPNLNPNTARMVP